MRHFKQLREKSPQQEVASLVCGCGYPARDGLYAASSLTMPRIPKQQIIKPIENAGQARVGLNVDFAIHALSTHKFIPIVVSAFVHVVFAPGCHGRCVNYEFTYTHHAVRVIVHFQYKYCGIYGGGCFSNIGRRTVNATRVVVPATPICVFTPRIIVKPRTCNLVHLFITRLTFRVSVFPCFRVSVFPCS